MFRYFASFQVVRNTREIIYMEYFLKFKKYWLNIVEKLILMHYQKKIIQGKKLKYSLLCNLAFYHLKMFKLCSVHGKDLKFRQPSPLHAH